MPKHEHTTTIDRVDHFARTLSAHEFEYIAIKHISRRWNRALADQFNAFAAGRLNVRAKPIVFDLHSRRWLGMNSPEAIRLNADQSDKSRWRTLLHEIAHYRVVGHRRRFVLELGLVYKLWKEFLQLRSEQQRRS